MTMSPTVKSVSESEPKETRLVPREPIVSLGIATTNGASTSGPEKDANSLPQGEETLEMRVERLGRERPAQFATIWSEVAFCFSICMSQILTEYFVSGFNVILPTLTAALSIPPASATWPASAFSLVLSSFLLISGRLADIHGGRHIYIIGMAWLALWSLVAGFSQNQLMLDFCRALQGLGPSAFLPTSVMLLGSVYRPGPRKNLVFSLYGGCAALGFFVGIFFAGVAGQYTTWGWYFWIGAILAGLTTVSAWFSIPTNPVRELRPGEPKPKMDWLGAVLIVSGLILVVFAITDSAHATRGWSTPYIYVTFVVGVLLLCVATYVEGWVVEQPLVPSDLFEAKYMKPLCVALFFTYGGMGIIFLYGTFYMENILHAHPLLVVAYWLPTAIGGCLITTLLGPLLHLIPGTVLAIFAGTAWLLAPLLFAVAHPHAPYWEYIFPAMICTTLGIDITFTITNIFITTTLPADRQGLAGALTNSILQLAIAFFLGLGDIVVTQTGGGSVSGNALQGTLLASYRNVFWFEVGLAGVGLLVMLFFVRIGEAKSELTADDV